MNKLIFLYTAVLILALPLTLILSKSGTTEKAVEGVQIIQTTPAVKKPAPAVRKIAAYVYIDQNTNGERDMNEKPFPAAVLTLSSKYSINPTGKILPSVTGRYMLQAESNPVLLQKTDTNGYVLFSIQSGSLIPSGIRLSVPAGYRTTTRNPVPLNQLSSEMKKIVEFGITAVAVPSGSISPVPSCMPKPPCLSSVPRCYIAEPAGGWCPATTVIPLPQPTEPVERFCAQVLTWGRNTETKECREFPTACLPAGWMADRTCGSAGSQQMLPQ